MKRQIPERVSATIAPDDGRNIDPEVGSLEGEGALQRVRDVQAISTWPEAAPTEAKALDAGPSYYNLPALKEPVWKWYIPAYLYVGGLSGACAALGAAADLLGDGKMGRLSRQCRIAAAAGAAMSAVLLVADLGRPRRFLHMLRVFRPSSPMNVGTWILSAFGGCAGLAALPAFVGAPARGRGLADGAALCAGLIGLPLTGYTGVLLANTAVPLWQGARRSLPILFSASGAAAAASMLDMLPRSDAEADVVHRFGIISKATELAMTAVLEREVAVVSRVARPLRSGFSGGLWRAAQLLSAASLVLSLTGRRQTSVRTLAGVLGTAGALAVRFALFHGGKRSARDPRATFEQQRAGRGAAELARAKKAPAAANPVDREARVH